ncbi:MAG: DJ-1/PfpI family protein [Deltaproteobacteria bacterium]|jgi:4-methyl-5(b-hydroxyethyl)-thiazole monophosphate biosynthesis|nr:DJ-1/PfpI family protein [Deltaproteobacteria bacterium]
MPKAAVFLINGFEEIEAVTIIDVLRRGDVSVDLVSLESGLETLSKHKVIVNGEMTLSGLVPENYDMLIIPGGTLAYLDHSEFMTLIDTRAKAGQKIAAICAAPVVLGRLGILKGRKAVCYPGLENELTGAILPQEPVKVVTDGNVTTSRGPATALPFSLELLSILDGPETSAKVAKDMLV